jgi:hypothetical protein
VFQKPKAAIRMTNATKMISAGMVPLGDDLIDITARRPH